MVGDVDDDSVVKFVFVGICLRACLKEGRKEGRGQDDAKVLRAWRPGKCFWAEGGSGGLEWVLVGVGVGHRPANTPGLFDS